MNSSTHKGLGCIAVALAGLAAAASAVAQTAPAPVPNAGRVLESAPPAPQELKKDGDVLPAAVASRPAPSDDGPTLLVKGFQLTGNTVFPDSVLLPLVQPWVGKQVNTDQLLDAAEAIRNRYKDAGYFLAQVFVPAQTVDGGIVTLRVVEARIGATRAEVTTTRVHAALVDGYMKLLPAGSAVTEQGVERPLLLLNDLPGVKVNSVLRPGAQTGDADLVVKVSDEGKAVTADAYVDNAGTESTGYARVGADLVANGLLGLGESWTLGGLVSERAGITLVRGGVTVPVGPYGTKATANLTALHYKVGKPFESADAKGDAAVGSLLLQHPLVRSRNFNLFTTGGLDLKYVDDKNVHDEKRNLYILHGGVTGDFRDELFGGSLNSYGATFSVGDNHITDAATRADDQDPRTGGHRTAGTFELLEADYQRLQAITATTSALLSMRGQVAFKNLDSSEKSSLGGPHGVRAYAVGDGVGDNLFQGTFELRQRVPSWSLWGAPVVFSGFVDGGYVENWHSTLSSDSKNTFTLGGYGLGLNLTARDDFQLRLDVAHRINRSALAGSDNHRTRVWASLQKWF